MLRFSSRAAVLHEPVDVRTALGLKLSDDDLIGDDREAMLAAVAPLWPIATLALLLRGLKA